MKTATTADFKALQAAGGSRLHFATRGETDYWQFLGDRAMERLPKYIDSLIIRLTKDDANSKIAAILKVTPKPFDIWLYEWEKDIQDKTFWRNTPYTRKEKQQSFYFVFHESLTHEQGALWNMWIMGYFTRSFR